MRRLPLLFGMIAWFVIPLTGCPGKNDGIVSPGDPPAPYEGSLRDAPECELSADCPEGTYCDLGQCYQACTTVDPCTGDLVCIPRGRCDDTVDAPADPPVVTSVPATVRADVSVIRLGPTDQAAILTIEASDPNANVRYRIDPEVPWIRAAEPRGEFTGTLVVMLQVDRSRLESGEYGGNVVVRTTHGDVTVGVQLQQSLTASYSGAIRYESPRPLGTIPLAIEMREESGFAAIRVDSSRSPFFPQIDLDGVGGPDEVTTSAAVVDGVVSGSITQVFTNAFLGGNAVVDRTIGREFSFELEVAPGGVLRGSFTERWFGIFTVPVSVSGSIELARDVGSENTVGAIDVRLPPELPANPSPNPAAIASACSNVAMTVTNTAGNGCGASDTASELAACGNAMRQRGATIDEPSGGGLVVATMAGGTSGYGAFEVACDSGWPVSQASAPAPVSTAVPCVHRGNLQCAYSLLGNAANLGAASARASAYATVSSHASAALFLANAKLVEAYRTPYSGTGGNLVDVTRLRLSEAAIYARVGLREMFSANLLELLRTTPTSDATSANFYAVRRLAQLSARYSDAFHDSVTLDVRTGASSAEALRDQIAKTGLANLSVLVTLATIAEAEQAPTLPELALLSNAVSKTGQLFLETNAEAPILGVPRGFVPFIYDPLRAGATNFDQNLDEAQVAIAASLAADQTANDATKDFEQQVNTLTSEINALNSNHRGRLVSICGSLPGQSSQPNLANCGATTGEMAVARSSFTTSGQEVDLALQRIQSLGSRIQNEVRRLNEVQGIRREYIAFANRTGQQLNAIDIHNAKLNLAKEALQAAASGSLFSPNGYVSSVGIAMIGTVQMDLQKRRQDLVLTQELQALTNETRIEYINGMASIKEMLIAQAELNIEVAIAMSRAQTAAIAITNLEQEKDFLAAEYEVNVARLSDPTRPLANNPAFRVLRSRAIVAANRQRDIALRATYLAALAFEFETNTALASTRDELLPALRASEINDFATNCLDIQYTSFRQTYGARQTYVEELSLREDVLGIRGDITDPITGQVVTAAEQFRQRLLAPSNLSNNGVVTLVFATGVGADNGIFSTSVCNDQIRTIQAKLIGDGQGDNQARIHLDQRGTVFQRACEAFRNGGGDLIREYAVPDSQQNHAVIQAGINAYGDMTAANTQLYGRAVGASQWQLSIPPGAPSFGVPGPVEPSNADLDLTRLEDIVLRIEHSAISLNASGPIFNPVCQ